jgi:oxygen-independent coproporphyrinogen-3 oxidase
MLTSSSPDLRRRLRDDLRACAYPGYVYGYPHKKAYRPLPPRPLAQVWAGEDCRHLFCYVHIPFCGQRCSFCNLFTYVPGDDPAGAYLDALAREMDAYAEALSPYHFARLYIGGGTPTYLDAAGLRRLAGDLRSRLGVQPAHTHGCIEASPETVDEEKVELLRELGFVRVSLGVQSLVEQELRQVNRRFDFALHDRAIGLIGRAGFPHFNIDLIYGLPGQTRASFAYSLERAIDSCATSLFLYPLYIRPRTGLASRGRANLDDLACPTTHEMGRMYDDAVERLARAGFRQSTMRQFRRESASRKTGVPACPGAEEDRRGRLSYEADEYRCQEHGMVGLGAGARSYTAGLHYSTPWRMTARNIRAVVDDYVARMALDDTAVSHGFALDDDERRRRFVLQTLLYDGLDMHAFRAAFGVCARAAFPEAWEALAEEGCVRDDGDCIRLTPRGVRHADVVGQLFFSERVRALMETYEYDS